MSFFLLKNSSESAFSKGCIAFFLVKRAASGFFREKRSEVIELIRLEVEVERKNRAFFGFSTNRGARAVTARAARAFLGLLVIN